MVELSKTTSSAVPTLAPSFALVAVDEAPKSSTLLLFWLCWLRILGLLSICCSTYANIQVINYQPSPKRTCL